MIRKPLLIVALLLLNGVLCASDVWKASDQEKARQKAHEAVPFVEKYLDEDPIMRRMRLYEEGLSLKDIENSYFLLDSPIISEVQDHYAPVRFPHGQHAASVQDCTACHHYRPEDKTLAETARCASCHQEFFDSETPERTGLKAAYHLQCVSCHEQQARGPVMCRDCHLKNVPDHRELVNLPEKPDPFQVTAECLRCHDAAAENMLSASHWLWTGPSLYTAKRRKEVRTGKGTIALNNY